jgi:hypothetical protein
VKWPVFDSCLSVLEAAFESLLDANPFTLTWDRGKTLFVEERDYESYRVGFPLGLTILSVYASSASAGEFWGPIRKIETSAKCSFCWLALKKAGNVPSVPGFAPTRFFANNAS